MHSGAGNTNVEPRLAVIANPHILTNSPCVNAGSNQAWMVDSLDLDRRQRVVTSLVDLGAYEIPATGTFMLLR